MTRIPRLTIIGHSILALAALGASFSAHAQIKVGVSISTTGPAASLGIPEKNTFGLLPTEIAGQKVQYIVLDDASDATQAVKNARKLISEDKVDVLIGSSITPTSLAMLEVAAETETPLISIAGASRIVEPMDAKRRWVFKTTQHDGQMANAIATHMSNNGVKTMGFIGFSDAYGEGWYGEVAKYMPARKIKIAANERFARTDTSVTGQVLKLMAANPDAILIAGSGTPAALPQKALRERGYKGKIYQTHGVANSDFLRVCGADCEGTFVPVGPMLVANQLPDANPVKKSALAYTTKYTASFGKDSVSTFGGHAWDAQILLAEAAKTALPKAKPGTKEFRAALRDSLEGLKNVPAAHGIFNMSPTNHQGLDQRSQVMVKIEKGAWKYVP
ncbi:ABC transporter substrate-binding protein [Massilia sp. Mn16-1_5]|uniref:ABC transporter substrate-binding protein n=1 Tax=Massilia sp. Mn16-1_5 TaxID=2079199 RepID=UPI00109EC9A0|nr:ABC transporter substrate-binding protein [Massilia sp. Mn16-1_5]THC46687.1 branched-chain amino acid ABC transporter substrate-binding protein [Massilia sp. Mn16-1_5]